MIARKNYLHHSQVKRPKDPSLWVSILVAFFFMLFPWILFFALSLGMFGGMLIFMKLFEHFWFDRLVLEQLAKNFSFLTIVRAGHKNSLIENMPG